MDDIVKQAMAKWPNVPHCYGWLALDARGGWRMRDERAQMQNLPGDRINNATLLGFINRNYTHDEQGRWYFQNGPQRVYVNLEATPYIAHTDNAHGFVLHTGELLSQISQAWITEGGELILQDEDKVAMVDDRDLAQCLAQLEMHGKPVSDDALLVWLTNPDAAGDLHLRHGDGLIPVERIARSEVPARFGFDPSPQLHPA